MWKHRGLVNGKGGKQRAKLVTVQEEPLLITEGIAVSTEAKFEYFSPSQAEETVLTLIEKKQKKEDSKAAEE